MLTGKTLVGLGLLVDGPSVAVVVLLVHLDINLCSLQGALAFF